MEVKAKLGNLRIAPRKVRLVADLVRGKKVKRAQNILNFTIKKASSPLFKLLKSAVANAENNFHLEPENLYISKITVNEGPKYKRFMPRARGQSSMIQKKTSHVLLILSEITPAKGKKEEKTGEEGEIKEPKEVHEKREIKKTVADSRAKDRARELKTARPKKETITRRFFQRKTV